MTVKSDKLAALEREIIEKTYPETTVAELKKIVEQFSEPIIDKKLPYEDFVKEIFGLPTVYEIYEALKNTTENKEFAQKAIVSMDAHSPLSMNLIHELIKRAKTLYLKEAIQNEMRVGARILAGTEFYEGVRCTLVDRNDKPKWMYPTLKDVPRDEVLKYFEKLPAHLELDIK